MKDRNDNIDRDYTDRGEYNQRLGRELHQRDQEQHRARYGTRRPDHDNWDEETYFHTGPSKRGAQDRGRDTEQRSYYEGGARNSSYQQGQNAHLNDHYGSRSDSPYRNESSYLNHGNRGYGNQHQQNSSQQANRNYSNPGNFNELPDAQDDLWREGPGSRSRYKESDYRYGSGSHNWYREGRYTPDEDRDDRNNQGFFDRVRNTWNDIMHADDSDYQMRHHHPHHEKGSDRVRMGSEPYRDRHFDKGYEGGPRWADESDTDRNKKYHDKNRNDNFL